MKQNFLKYGAVLFSSLCLCACSSNETPKKDEETPPVEEVPEWNKDETLKILTIGNSFSDDAMEYIANIALDLGIKNVKLGNLYIGGCSLNKHYNNAIKDLAAYEYRTNDGSGWQNKTGTSISQALEDEDWDFISLQQNSGDSGISDSYSPYLEDLIEYLAYSANENAKFVFHMTWAYQQNSTHQEFVKYNKNQITMYEAIVNAVDEKVRSNPDITQVIPVGTAIQNARTSFVGDTLTRDGYHLTMDFGRYVAGLTFVKKLTGLNIDNLTYAPQNVDESYKKVAIESVNNAVSNPDVITPSKFDKEPSYDYSNYHELDLGLTQFGYWNATEANNYNKIITNANNSNQFYASRRLTRLDLPIGSIIELKTGYGYRPEAWLDDSRQTSRPPLTSTKRVEVTEKWWGKYVYRAFNIYKSGNPSLQGNTEAPNALKIYVPNDAEINYEELKIDFIENAYYDSTSDNYASPIKDDSLSNKFFTTKRFSEDELPIGSIIRIKEGWQYRPEAWVKDEKQSSRPTVTKQDVTVVTQKWWSDYTLRAFNISKSDNSVISGVDKSGIFTIYIPN
ncbi:MAG: DUF4886 domain-containing protein [bacterium]|nr:DUF4886 domain-containing protein [bacterium]